MRTELQALLAPAEAASEADFGRIIDLCSCLALSHWQQTHAPFANRPLASRIAMEALADQNFRSVFEVQFVWQFGLWRLQAIFESLIDQRFLSGRKVRGLTKKLQAIAIGGYTMAAADTRELHDWTQLRNALSH